MKNKKNAGNSKAKPPPPPPKPVVPGPVPSTIDPEALWNKSKLFIERALKARDDDDDALYHVRGG